MMLRLLAVWMLWLGLAVGATISAVPAVSSVGIGQSIAVSVMVDSVTDLYAYQFDIAFAPGTLEAQSVSEAGFLPAGGPTIFLGGAFDNLNGYIFMTAASLEGAGGVSGSGTLAVLSFLAVGSGASDIEVRNVILLDSSLSGIRADVVSGAVEVVSAPEPSGLWLSAFGVAVILGGRYPRRLIRVGAGARVRP
jgi:hypothetical protein